MNTSGMGKWKIGLLVLGVLSLALFGFVLTQAGKARQDNQTLKAANSIADKLNNYTEQNDTVPNSLSQAGITKVPPAITYTKKSDSSYEFCIAWKTSSINVTSDAQNKLLQAETGSLNGSSNVYGNYPNYALYIDSSHKAGKHCQTVQTFAASSESCGLLCSELRSDTGGSVNAGSNAATQDVTRQTDIAELQAIVETYYADNGTYPTLAEMNDANWRDTNLYGLDVATLCDPSASSSNKCTLASQAAKGVYAYQPVSESGAACTTDGQCANFTLTATLSDGTTFVKKSTN